MLMWSTLISQKLLIWWGGSQHCWQGHANLASRQSTSLDQRTSVQHCVLSSPCPVISGAPQASVIGEMIFFILKSAIDENTLHSLIASFADDTSATKGIKCQNDAVNLQEHLFHINQWNETNNIPLKTQIKRQSVRCFRVKLFNALPKHIRKITRTASNWQNITDVRILSQ